MFFLFLSVVSLCFSQTDTVKPLQINQIAPSPADTNAKIDRLVVTGTRTARTIKDNPSPISVISKQQIASSAALNVGDLLQFESGIVMKRSVGMGEGVPQEINIRGVPSATAATRTLILVDGIPTNVAGTPFLIVNEVPMESIERIEIVSGPFSNLYGPNAFGGVINIITKSPKKDTHAEIYGGGFSGFYDVGGNASGSLGRFSYLVDAGLRGIDNYYLRDSIDHISTYDRKTPADNYGYYDKRFLGKFNYALSSRILLTINARYFESDLGFGKTEYGHPQTDISVLGQKLLLGPVLKLNISPGFDMKLSGFYRNVNGTFYDQGIRADSLHDTVGSVWKSQSNDFQIDYQTSIKIGDFNSLTCGMDFLYNSIDFGPRFDEVRHDLLKNAYGDTEAMNNAGLYVQDEMKIGEKLVCVAGIRIDDNSIFNAVLSPRLGLVYKQTSDIRYKVSFGRGFRSPSLGELYLPDMPINTSTTLQANPALQPEYIWALDAGPEFEFTKQLSLKVSGFYNAMDHLIVQKIVNGNYMDVLQNATLSHKNIDKARSYGLENSIEYRIFAFANLFANYTYTESEDMDMHTRLEYIPRHSCNFGVYFDKKINGIGLYGSVLEQFTDTRDYLDWQKTLLDSNLVVPEHPTELKPSMSSLPSYLRTDLSVKIMYDDFVWLGIDAMNLFDADIAEVAGTYSPKRFIEARIGFKF